MTIQQNVAFCTTAFRSELVGLEARWVERMKLLLADAIQPQNRLTMQFSFDSVSSNIIVLKDIHNFVMKSR